MDQVRRLLDDEPGNSEYEDMEKELAEVTLFFLALFINSSIIIFFGYVTLKLSSSPTNVE